MMSSSLTDRQTHSSFTYVHHRLSPCFLSCQPSSHPYSPSPHFIQDLIGQILYSDFFRLTLPSHPHPQLLQSQRSPHLKPPTTFLFPQRLRGQFLYTVYYRSLFCHVLYNVPPTPNPTPPPRVPALLALPLLPSGGGTMALSPGHEQQMKSTDLCPLEFQWWRCGRSISLQPLAPRPIFTLPDPPPPPVPFSLPTHLPFPLPFLPPPCLLAQRVTCL